MGRGAIQSHRSCGDDEIPWLDIGLNGSCGANPQKGANAKLRQLLDGN